MIAVQDWYPPASRQQTYPTDGRRYSDGYAWKLVLHSTEGTSWPSYDNSAPHFTIDCPAGEVRQHYPLSYPAKALRQPDSPATNKGRAVQIEIIGTCDPSKRNMSSWAGWFLPDWRPTDFYGLPELIGWICEQTGIEPDARVTFWPYPESYGNTAARMTESQWRDYNRVSGHQHVPGNDHGDPGDIDVAGILNLVTGGPPPPQPTQEVDMFYGTDSTGQGWLCNGIRKQEIKSPAYRDTILKTGVPNIGGQSSDFWSQFPRDDAVIDTLNKTEQQTRPG